MMYTATTAAPDKGQAAVSIGTQEQKALTFPIPEKARPYLIAIGKFEDAATVFTNAVESEYAREYNTPADKDCEAVWDVIQKIREIVEPYMINAINEVFWTTDAKGGHDNE